MAIGLTTKEAGRTWCPHVRWAGGGMSSSSGMNRPPGAEQGEIHKNCLCWSAGCSQWRWVYALRQLEGEGGGTRLEQTDRGYCGLAGVPTAARVATP